MKNYKTSINFLVEKLVPKQSLRWTEKERLDIIKEANEMAYTEFALFLRWLIKHYSTSDINGMFTYIDSQDREVSIEQIIEHWKSEQ